MGDLLAEALGVVGGGGFAGGEALRAIGAENCGHKSQEAILILSERADRSEAAAAKVGKQGAFGEHGGMGVGVVDRLKRSARGGVVHAAFDAERPLPHGR